MKSIQDWKLKYFRNYNMSSLFVYVIYYPNYYRILRILLREIKNTLEYSGFHDSTPMQRG